MAISLAAFVTIYVFIFGAGSYYILRLISKGPATESDTYGDHGIPQPPLFAQTAPPEGGDHV